MLSVIKNKKSGAWQRYFFIFILLIMFFLFKDSLVVLDYSWLSKYFKINKSIITYRLGDLDQRFGLNNEEVVSIINEAEKIWEDPYGKELFNYSPEGDLVINFVYDKRQASTNELQNLDSQVSEETAEFESYKNGYDALVQEYKQKKASLEEKFNKYNAFGLEYENSLQVAQKDGLNTEELEYFNSETRELDQIFQEIREEQSKLTDLVARINSLAQGANRSLPQLNDDVRAYNNLLADNSEEFQEGEYLYRSGKKTINIYQFNDRQDLVFLLAHELGHALGLEHSADINSLMYKLNYSQTASVTQDDLNKLKDLY